MFVLCYHFINKMTRTISEVALLIRSGNDLCINDELCMSIDSDTSVEVATKRVNVDGV